MKLGHASSLVLLLCAAMVAGPAMAADPPAAPPPTDAQQPPATRPLAAIVVTQALRDARWNREWGEFITGGKTVNDLAQAISGQTQAMLAKMGYDTKIVGPDEKVDGARFYLTPDIKQNQETTGVWAMSRVTDTIVLEWRVADGNGGTVLVDTVTGTGESALGNVFTAHSEAKLRFQRLMDDLFAKSQTLLTPALPQG